MQKLQNKNYKNCILFCTYSYNMKIKYFWNVDDQRHDKRSRYQIRCSNNSALNEKNTCICACTKGKRNFQWKGTKKY